MASKLKPSTFNADELGFVHIDVKSLPQMLDENRGRSLCVAIDRAQRSGVCPGQDFREHAGSARFSPPASSPARRAYHHPRRLW
ncbi:hypothetical protein GWK36_05035 [Caldichromatium japonicum]|uniref:Uncharacterized protein n=1 Tax=Caldichromatium japonicum TaxID=2699430 RepID=A0A6G7VCD2_9GAMM|nr:hypothetical protein GWK36_05035 [Caldichromatium japonicum]